MLPTTFSLPANQHERILHFDNEIVEEPLTQDSGLGSESDEEILPAGFYGETNHRLLLCMDTSIHTRVKTKRDRNGTMRRYTAVEQEYRRGRCFYCGKRTRHYCKMCTPKRGAMHHWCCYPQEEEDGTRNDASSTSSSSSSNGTCSENSSVSSPVAVRRERGTGCFSCTQSHHLRFQG